MSEYQTSEFQTMLKSELKKVQNSDRIEELGFKKTAFKYCFI